MGFRTDAIHAGQDPDPTTGAVSVPIYQTSTYVQEGLGRHKGYEYARTRNPTREALEKNIAVLEGGLKGFAFASGLAAETAVAQLLLGQGDHAICSHGVYGGTYRLFEKIVRNHGVDFSWVDTSNARRVREALRPETRMIFVETPTNPLMTLTDLEAVAEIAREAGCRLVVDNTFMTPYLQRPLALGADIVLHSATKFLNGHSDSIGGLVVVSREDDAERLGFIQNAAGAILSPFDSWLIMRGIKTLPIRMEAHSSNGRAVASYLASNDRVSRVCYPGLPDHPQHQLACRQMAGFGGVMSFDLGSLDAARSFLERLELCALGESLGGVETLVSHPATMTHAALPRKERERGGITEGLVRLSIGIEDTEDLIADLDNAFAG